MGHAIASEMKWKEKLHNAIEITPHAAAEKMSAKGTEKNNQCKLQLKYVSMYRTIVNGCSCFFFKLNSMQKFLSIALRRFRRVVQMH